MSESILLGDRGLVGYAYLIQEKLVAMDAAFTPGWYGLTVGELRAAGGQLADEFVAVCEMLDLADDAEVLSMQFDADYNKTAHGKVGFLRGDEEDGSPAMFWQAGNIKINVMLMNDKVTQKLGSSAFMSRSVVKIGEGENELLLPALAIKMGFSPVDGTCDKEIAFNIFTRSIEEGAEIKPVRQSVLDILAMRPTGDIKSAADALGFYCGQLAECEDVRKSGTGSFNGTICKFKELPIGEYVTSTPEYREFNWLDPESGKNKLIKSYQLRCINIETGEQFLTSASLASFVGNAISNQPRLKATAACYLRIASKRVVFQDKTEFTFTDNFGSDGVNLEKTIVKTFVNGDFGSSVSVGMKLCSRQAPVAAAKSIHPEVAKVLDGKAMIPSAEQAALPENDDSDKLLAF